MSNTIIYYPLRPLAIPSGYTFPAIPNTGSYTDAQITALYYKFLSCYSEKINKVIANKIKGIYADDACMSCENKYLLMALWILRGWYNPNGGQITFTPVVDMGTYSVALSFVSAYGVISGSGNIITITGATSVSDMVAQLQSGLPSGYIVLLNSNGTITITFPSNTVFPYQWIFINKPGASPQYSWQYLTAFNSCISTDQINCIISKCLDICGCYDCMANSLISQDNYYVPIGQFFTPPSGQVTLQPLPFFNYN